jgi:DNA-binding NtrC family response regulator
MWLELQQPQARIGLRQANKIDDMESEIIRTAISRYDGHMSEVARRLGIGRSTLYRKLKEFGLEETVQGEPPDEVRKAG